MERSFPQELHSFGRRRIGATPQDSGRGAERVGATDPVPGRMESALKQLPEQEQAILKLRLVSGFSTTAIAAELGQSEQTIRVAQHQGLERLRRVLAEAAPDPPRFHAQ